MITKKMLAPFDLKKPNKRVNGFLYPSLEENEVNKFLEMTTGKEWDTGIVVFTGVALSENDLFTRIIDSGKEIKSVNSFLISLNEYLNQVKSFKIGDIVGIKSVNDGFELVKLSKPKRRVSKLP